MVQRLVTVIALLLVCAAPLVTADISSHHRERLGSVLASQSEEHKARQPSRNPAETLAFFGIEPGMTVVEVLPGGGWYSRVLSAYLGEAGTLIGADYPFGVWPAIGYDSEEFLEKRRAWPETWPQQASEWQAENGARLIGQRIGSIELEYNGTADAVLFIRALHNLNRVEDRGGFRSAAIADAWSVLKSGGVVGVVQHMAPPGRSDAWADGSRGYMNRDAVVRHFESMGFELVDESDVNRNPEDEPGMDEVVWRLPPNLQTSQDDPDLRSRYEAVGESNRMTLLFRKPEAA
ncbi:MAG: hypothetical protein R6V11_02245 [Ectothiorhodospiraceae bacterium]